MDIKIIKGKNNYLFSSLIEYKEIYKRKVESNWRDGKEGDWVYTDDFYICQILKKAKLKHPGYKIPRTMIRTVCGSFIVEQKTHIILGKNGVAQNVYAFSGNYKANYDRKNRKLKTREFIFAHFVSSGLNIIDSYKKAYPKAKDKKYIKEKISTLLNKKKVRTMITKGQQPSLFTNYIKKEKNQKLCNEYVYFIKSNNCVKIGVSIDPKKRLSSLQTANSYKLELIGYINGDSIKERQIQAELNEYHIRGEWFKYCKDVKNFINKAIKTERMCGNEIQTSS